MEMQVCGPSLELNCGTLIRGCGTPCEIGTCSLIGVCSNFGAACTSAEECAPGERCGYNHDTGGRQCTFDDDGSECNEDDPCLDTSVCVAGICRWDCWTESDCPEGQTCVPYQCIPG